jgi:site-specific DNA recombinase
MKLAAIYARFSTDLQNERSIDDQVALCRAYAAREGFEIVAIYEDRARSGGSIMGRDGVLRLLEHAREHKFEAVIVEALDRLSRDMEDLAGIHKRLTFAGVEIRAIHEGQVNTVLVGLRGLVGQLYREDNVHKIKRGLAGRVREGRSAGGLPYGYAPVPGQPGERVIVEAQAEIIRRIFTEYADGATPRDIAHDLNAEGIPAPRGRAWVQSAINGGAGRGYGILRNEIYIGRITWNRCRMVRNPETGKRLHRVNATSELMTGMAPELAIVPIELWDAVQTQLAEIARLPASHQRKPRHLFSGLLRCAACSSGMAVAGKDKSGRTRLRCSRHHESGDCPNPKTYYLDVIEHSVLSALKRELRKPVALTEYVRVYREEWQRLTANADQQRKRIERRLGEIDRELARITDLMIRGIGAVDRLDARAKELQYEERRLKAEATITPRAASTIALHPALLARFEHQINQLETIVVDVAIARSPSSEAIRNLVRRITIGRDENSGQAIIDIEGSLNALMHEQKKNKVWGSMVAEEGLEPPTYGL